MMTLTTKKKSLKGAAFLCSASLFCVGLHAQSSTPPPANPTTTTTTTTSSSGTGSGLAQDQVTTLEKYTVSDVPVTEQILPTVRPISSVYGDDRSIVDIPRSVSSVNSAWMDDRQVKSAMDFGQFAPGVYAAADYGIPGVPQIRGDTAQIYVNGQEIPYSRNSTPLSFNGVEAMDIVKGPGTAVYGPRATVPAATSTSSPSSPTSTTTTSTSRPRWAPGRAATPTAIRSTPWTSAARSTASSPTG